MIHKKTATSNPDPDNRQAENRVNQAGKQFDSTAEPNGRVHEQRLAAPNDPGEFIEKHDQAESRKNLIQMLPIVKPAEHHIFHPHAHKGGDR